MGALYFYQITHLQNFEARVTAVDADAHSVLLDQTAFYPVGGGQLADCGVLIWRGTQLPVVRARKAAEGIWHALT